MISNSIPVTDKSNTLATVTLAITKMLKFYRTASYSEIVTHNYPRGYKVSFKILINSFDSASLSSSFSLDPFNNCAAPLSFKLISELPVTFACVKPKPIARAQKMESASVNHKKMNI
jgi:hypothetical protein